MAAQGALHGPLSNATTKARHPRRRHSLGSVLPSPSSASDSADRRPSTADSTASSGWESQVDTLAELFEGKMTVTSTQDLPIMSGDRNRSPIDRHEPVFANPFSEHNYAGSRPTSPGIVGTDPVLRPETAHTLLHSPASSRAPVTRSVASEDEHDTVPPGQSVNKTYAFVSLPGNAVRKRPRRRYDEIERLYHCSWSGCTKAYGTLNHLNAHIVMARHGNKRTPDEFKELRKQWRKAKKDESEPLARPEQSEALRSEPSLQYSPQPYERPPESVPYGQRHRLYSPGTPGPEMNHQLAGGKMTARYPLSAEASSMRHQPLQQPYDYAMSGSGHSLSSVVPHMPSSRPEQAIQYEGTTLPQYGSTPAHAHHLPPQAVSDYEREHQGHSWTPPSVPHPPPSARPVPSYKLSPSYTQPQPPLQRVNALPPDSTLLTPLPGYQPSTVEPEHEEEYDNKQQVWTEQQQQHQG